MVVAAIITGLLGLLLVAGIVRDLIRGDSVLL